MDEILKFGFVQNTVIVGIVFAEEAAEFGQELFVPLELEVEENLFLKGGTEEEELGDDRGWRGMTGGGQSE